MIQKILKSYFVYYGGARPNWLAIQGRNLLISVKTTYRSDPHLNSIMIIDYVYRVTIIDYVYRVINNK